MSAPLPPITAHSAMWAARYCRAGNIGALTQLFNPQPEPMPNIAAEKLRDARWADQVQADQSRRDFNRQLERNGRI